MEDVTLEEIQKLLEEHLATYNPSLEIGTAEFYDYVIAQLFEKADTVLSQRDDYNLIHAYLVEYKVAYDDYLYCQCNNNQPLNSIASAIVEENPCLSINSISGSVVFDITSDFLSQTIGDIIDRYASDELTANANRSSISIQTSYSGTAAATYAQQYATSHSGLYPDYTYDGGDCTNFVSQCLYAGGINMVGSGVGPSLTETTTEWYCINSGTALLNKYAVTTSWMRVADFNTYMTSVASSKTLKLFIYALNNSCSVGDVVQLADRTTGTPYHTIIISAKDSTTSYFCGHSNDRLNYDIANLDEENDRFILFKFS